MLGTMRLGKLFDHFLNIFLKCKQPLTDVLQNLNQHQLSVFLRTIYCITKELLLWYRERNDSHFRWHQMAWGTFDNLCKKAPKRMKELERKYYTKNLCIIHAVQICNSFIHHFKYFLGIWSWNFGIRVWKEAWFDTPK